MYPTDLTYHKGQPNIYNFVTRGKGFIMTNEELIRDIRCSKQSFWYKAYPVTCAMASVIVPASKLTSSTRFGIISMMTISLLGWFKQLRTFFSNSHKISDLP